MKKLAYLSQSLFVLFLLSFMFTTVNASTFTPTAYPDFTFRIEPNYKVTLESYSGSGGVVTIPSDVLDSSNFTYIVTGVEADAFKNKQLTSISIPASITNIGANAFANNYGLTTVNFNNNSGLTSLGSGIFTSTALANISATALNASNTLFNQLVSTDSTFLSNRAYTVTLDLANVTQIGNSTFQEGNIASISIPNSITHIGNMAFAYNSIASLDFNGRSAPFSSIGVSAFSGNSLTSISTSDLQLSDSVLVQLIETDGSFAENSIDALTFPTGITSIGEYTFADNELDSIIFPNTITNIGEEAFIANYLEDITLPNNLTTLGDGAFSENYLTEVTLPSSLMYIGNYVFTYNSIESITFLSDLSLDLFQIDFVDESYLVSGISTFASAYSAWNNGHYFYSTFEPDLYTTTDDILAGTYTLDVAGLLETANNIEQPNLLKWTSSTNSTPSTPTTPSTSTTTTTTPTSSSPLEPLPETGISSYSTLLLGLGLVMYIMSHRIRRN
jgi:BspA type Leucine rich repeat region (6 copies)